MADVTIHIDNAKGIEFLNSCYRASQMETCLIEFILSPQQEGESDLEFGKRCLVTMAKALMKKAKRDEVNDDYTADLAAATHYEPDNDILT